MKGRKYIIIKIIVRIFSPQLVSLLDSSLRHKAPQIYATTSKCGFEPHWLPTSTVAVQRLRVMP